MRRPSDCGDGPFTIAGCYSNSRASCAMQGLSVMSILSGVTAMHPPVKHGKIGCFRRLHGTPG
jgi:hypothetical protein